MIRPLLELLYWLRLRKPPLWLAVTKQEAARVPAKLKYRIWEKTNRGKRRMPRSLKRDLEIALGRKLAWWV